MSYLYRSGTGLFTFSGCKLIDAVMPLARHTNANLHCIPLFLSIKSHLYFPPGEAKTLCDAMTKQAQRSKLTEALCLVVVFGQSSSSTNDDYSLANKIRDNGFVDFSQGPVAAVLRIPAEDSFGISKVFRQLTGNTQLTEVYASHPFIRAYPTACAVDENDATMDDMEVEGGTTGRETDPLKPKHALRASNNSTGVDMLKKLTEQLRILPTESKPTQ